jgi:membrane protein
MTTSDCWGLLKDTGNGWVKDKVPRLAAALAFYTILSAAPLLVIALAIAGLAFGKEAAQGGVADQLRGIVGDQESEAIQAMIASASGPGSGVAMIVGVVLLLAGASGVFVELQDSLNTIWEVVPRKGRGILGVVHDRFLSLVMVFGVGFLLLVAVAASTTLAALTRFAGLGGIGMVGQALNFAASFAVVTLLFGMMYKILPEVRIAWGDVWIGALGTAFLFTVGNLLIGLYLGHASVGSSYGAAGSLVVFVVWVYYSGQILLLGAEFTKVYARRFGR